MAATPEHQVGRFSNSKAAGVGHRGSAESVAQVRQDRFETEHLLPARCCRNRHRSHLLPATLEQKALMNIPIGKLLSALLAWSTLASAQFYNITTLWATVREQFGPAGPAINRRLGELSSVP